MNEFAPPQQIEPEKLLVIACGMIAREVLAVRERHGFEHLELRCLPAEYHYYPDRIPPAMDAAITEARDEGFRHIFVGYGDCGTGGMLDKVCEKHGVERMVGPHCFAFYQGIDAFEKIADDDFTSFYVTDFLCRQFDAFFMRPLGLDRHPTVMPGATLHRREIAAAVGGWRLPHETRVPVDVDFAARVRARGYRCAHSRRATLFKFPSSSRRDVYVTRDVRQQTRVAGDLARDPDRAVEEGLAAVVEAFATGRGELSLESPPGTPGDVWRRAVRTKRSGPAAPRATVGAAEFSPEAGWSPLEVGAGGRPFRWTTGQAAHVVVPADGTADLDVEVGLAGAVTRAVRDTARITFGGRVLARGPDGEEGDVAVLRARAPATPGREAGLMISVVADAVCPRDAGLGDDPRTLGLAVAFVRASPAGGGAA